MNWTLRGDFPHQYLLRDRDCIVREFGPDSTEDDIRLIAAAPALLEALQGVLLTENDTHRESDDRYSVFRQAAHKAIALALGEEVKS